MQWNGQPLPEALRVRLAGSGESGTADHPDRRSRAGAPGDAAREPPIQAVALVRRLLQLRGIGDNAAWLFVMELFAWREFRNRRQVGGIGMVGTPYKSGLGS